MGNVEPTAIVDASYTLYLHPMCWKVLQIEINFGVRYSITRFKLVLL